MVLVATRPLHRKRVVPLVYDLYPDALEASGVARRDGLMSRLARRANRYWFRHADGLVFIGEKMAEHARDRYGEPRHDVVIETGADAAEFAVADVRDASPRTELEAWCAGKIVASYVGNMGAMHEWESLAEALPRVFADPAASRLAVVIAASGPGVERLRERWADLPADRLRFEAPLPDREWARLLVRSALALVTLRREASRTSIPSKTFSAMAADSAIVAVAPADSDLAATVERHACGVCVEPGDVDALAKTLVALAAEPKTLARLRAAARAAAVDHYDMPALAKRWRRFLETLHERD
jgi:glycosyltransferase involved in cell wall biosynthesis